MEKTQKKLDIKDFTHLYLGCEVMTEQGRGRLTEINSFGDMTVESENDIEYYEWVKLILRRLSDMTEGECDKYGIAYMEGGYIKDCFQADATYGTTFKVYGIPSLSERVVQMLKDGWDLFYLIDAGLAVDSKTLNS